MQSENATSGKTFFCDPVADVDGQKLSIAPRLDTLNGKVIGLLDNTKLYADVILNEAKELLLSDFPRAQFRVLRKESVSGANPETIRHLALCHAVITALGD
jgi:hypothetical protein